VLAGVALQVAKAGQGEPLGGPVPGAELDLQRLGRGRVAPWSAGYFASPMVARAAEAMVSAAMSISSIIAWLWE
jgi:hypothetical protein